MKIAIMSLRDFDVVIFAGGKGTRLAPAWDGPKCLAPIAGRPFVFYVLNQVAAAGAKRVVLALSHRADEVKRAVIETYANPPLEVVFSVDDGQHGEAGALHAVARLGFHHDKLLTLNGDTYVDTDLAELARDFASGHHGYASMCCDDSLGLCSGAVFYRLDSPMIGAGPRAHAQDVSFVDIGTPERYAQAQGVLRTWRVVS